MKKDWLNKIRKSIALGLIVGTTMVSTVVPVLGNEPAQPQISQWSIGTLNEGEKYGIYPVGWYADRFQEGVTEDKLDILLSNVERKISELELEKDPTFIAVDDQKDGSRGSVLAALYNSLASYKLPVELESNKGDAVAYMQKRGILNGTNKGLELEEVCTLEQATVFASKLIEDTYNASGSGAKGLMWEVKHEGNTIYLLGSIHVGDTSLYPIRKEVKDAFKESDVLVVEANAMNQQGLEEFMQIGKYADGTKLHDNVSEEIYAKCVAFLEKMGLPTDVYDDFKPWIVSNELSVMMMADTDSLEDSAMASLCGIDMYFLTSAMVTEKPVAELESLSYQANLFNDMPVELQEEQLSQTLDAVLDPDSQVASESVETLKLWFEKWYAGDIDGFTSSFLSENEKSSSEFEAMLFGKRDRDMADKLGQLLEKEGETTYFVVIGAGHLVVKDTVRDQLENKGYLVNGFWK